LPPAAGLETAMVALGVTPKQKDTARQVFQRSATEAGFFAYGLAVWCFPHSSLAPQLNQRTPTTRKMAEWITHRKKERQRWRR